MTCMMREMTWPEFAARKDDIIILPVGSTEQHAQHLTLCTDAVIAEEFAKALAEKVHGVVMPTLSYGYKSKPLSGGGPLFPGTIDLNGETVIKLTYDVQMELIVVDIANAKALPYFRYPLYKGDVPESGALASANSSSAQRGMIIVDSVIPELVKICHKEFAV